MPYVDRHYKQIPLHGLSLDLATFSAMSYFASEMNLPLNDAIALALKEWLTDDSFPTNGIEQ
jgi:hypothetical protein